ncbi:MAG TPA: hypothetical protein VEA16_00045 [Vicinamibacterales bacterium]|nr:hypothetical protein [Vicinamibacterales bacterium]
MPEVSATAAHLADLHQRGVSVERAAVIAIEGDERRAMVRVEGGRAFELAGLFASTRTHVAGTFATDLGCVTETHPMRSVYKTDPMTKQTTVPGVFACGDAAASVTALPFAVADGFRAGIGAHRSLVFPS